MSDDQLLKILQVVSWSSLSDEDSEDSLHLYGLQSSNLCDITQSEKYIKKNDYQFRLLQVTVCEYYINRTHWQSVVTVQILSVHILYT